MTDVDLNQEISFEDDETPKPPTNAFSEDPTVLRVRAKEASGKNFKRMVIKYLYILYIRAFCVAKETQTPFVSSKSLDFRNIMPCLSQIMPTVFKIKSQ